MSAPPDSPHGPRFERQERFAPLGPAGQRRLGEARVLIVGCGALGGVLAQTLARAGVGELVLVDRDVVELSNLPRQVLFEERHAAAGLPKVEAAAESLARIGGPTRLETHGLHLDAGNVRGLARGAALVLDGSDNLATRYLLNDFCVESALPWVYGGVVGSEGLVLAVLPGRGPCLRCLFPDPPPAGSLATCDSAGVILPAVGAVASLQAGLALRLLAGGVDAAPPPALLAVDAWEGGLRRVPAPRDPDCPACGRGEFPFLLQPGGREPVVLCGRNTVQVFGAAGEIDLEALSSTLAGWAGEVRRTASFLRLTVAGHRLTVFADGRTLVEGTEDPDRARALCDRVLGA